jgi:hypothetical protein
MGGVAGGGGIILLSMISLDHDRVVEIVMLYHVALLREKKLDKQEFLVQRRKNQCSAIF